MNDDYIVIYTRFMKKKNYRTITKLIKNKLIYLIKMYVLHW